jgi:hypothetical protein
MKNLSARVADLGRHFSKPLPRGLHVYPEPLEAKPPFSLAALSFATKLLMLETIRKLKPPDHPTGTPYVIDLGSLPLELKTRIIEELNARREEQTCLPQPTPR